MILKKTACLTALLMSFPYAATAADWNDHEVTGNSGTVSASGTETAPYEKTLNAEYDNVWFGRA
ncbi:MAG: hypothetical protein Q3990_06335, partial [Desulfovibrionaceae bacterium]|nr:hypothetical protein [Desulfovibrionaceae bacterium]